MTQFTFQKIIFLDTDITVVYTSVMKTLISIKTDREVKEGAVATAREMGVPLSTIVNAFLKKFIADKSVTLSAPLKPSKYLTKILKQADKDLKKGRNLSPIFYNMAKMDKYLAGL